MLRLPIDAVPDVTPNQVLVLTQAPGLGPLEVERFITFPVETAMSGLPGITDIRSVSRFGLSAVYIYFEENLDIYFVRRLVMERLPDAREAIPAGLGTPSMGPISSGLGEIYQFEVRGEGQSLMDLRSILEWDIAFKLRSVPGVVEVNSYGGELKTYEVQIDPDKLVSYNISLETGVRGPRRQQRQRRRRLHRTRAGAVRHPRRGAGREDRRHRQHRGGGHERHAGLHQEPRQDRAGTAGAARRRHARRPRRGRHRRRDDADGRERPRGRRSREDRTRGDQEQPAQGRHGRHLLRPHRPGAQDDQHRLDEPDRGRHSRRRRAAPDARQRARRPHRRGGHPALDAVRLHRHGGGRPLRQPDEPGRHRLRPDRRRLRRHDREHRPAAWRGPDAPADRKTT